MLLCGLTACPCAGCAAAVAGKKRWWLLVGSCCNMAIPLPSAERHISILDKLFMRRHAATTPADSTFTCSRQCARSTLSSPTVTAPHQLPLDPVHTGLYRYAALLSHLHLANQPSKVIGSWPEFCCSCAAGVAGIEQLYSMPQLASEDGEHPGA